MPLTVVVFTLLSLLTISQSQEIVVDLPEGRIAGHTLKSFLGNSYYAFQEIPYAAPPVGDLRFALPQNPQPWNGVLNTTRNTKECIQGVPGYSDPTVDQSEDCLYLNVYTPKVPGGSQRLPVYVWIHGGALRSGAGTFNFVNPSRFMDYEIIVVTLNYRLGNFGFLTTEDGVIPSNLGLKDQRFALRWVQSHIEFFGGNPKNVTIGGESAGSSSVAYQLLAQNSDGLFIGAIMQSGSAISQILYTSSARETAFLLGQTLNPSLNLSSSEDLLHLLKTTSVEDIVNASLTFESPNDNSAGYVPNLKWLPTIESPLENEAFLTVPMHDAYLHGLFHRVPVLMGYNSEEALFFIASAAGIDVAGSYDRDISLIIDRRLQIPATNRTFVAKELKKFYTNFTFSEDQAALVKLSSDSGFIRSILRQAEISSRYTAVYLYQFSYMGVLGETVIIERPYVPGAAGVAHGEDLGYFFEFGIPSTANASDFLTMQRLLKLWTNFIKNQNPTPEPDPVLNNVTWTTVEETDVKYLNINLTLEFESHPRHYSESSSLLLKHMEQPYIVI